jgi:hypothetical protein
VESFDGWIGVIDSSGPSLRPGTRTRIDLHRASGACRPRTAQIEERHWAQQFETDQPRVIPRTVDGSCLLKHLGEACRRVFCEINDAAGLQMRRGQMMVEASTCRPIRPERRPGRRGRAGAKVDPPASRPWTERMNNGFQTGELSRGRRLGELRHRVASELRGQVSDSARRISTSQPLERGNRARGDGQIVVRGSEPAAHRDRV